MPDPLKIYKALADETRLRMLRLLQRSVLNVNEVIEILQMGQSRISRHLKILADAELVTSRREGTWVYYQASTNGSGLVSETHEHLGRFESQVPHVDRDIQALESTIERRREQTRSFFDSISQPEQLPVHDNVDGQFYRELAASLFDESDTVLDMGTGAGLLLPALLEKASNVIAVDSSITMLEMARRSAGELSSRCDFRLGDLEHLPIADGEVDAVMACMVLHHLSTPAKALAEAGRALRPDGRLVVVDLHQHDDESVRERLADLWLGFEPTQIRKWLHENNFSIQGADIITGAPDSLKLITFQAKKGREK